VIELALRVGFSLLVILLLMWVMARVVRRPLGGNGHGELAVLKRQQLTRGSAVAVVRVADRAMVLGITEQQVSLLGEADLEDFEHHVAQHRDHLPIESTAEPAGLPEAHPTTPPGRLDGSLLSGRVWTSTVDFLRDRTTRQ
jgi:flagellar protein FliO/FliZ